VAVYDHHTQMGISFIGSGLEMLGTQYTTRGKRKPFSLGCCLAGDIGFEPILTESESAVLPLDESPFPRGNSSNL
jgi:hypothetical protein